MKCRKTIWGYLECIVGTFLGLGVVDISRPNTARNASGSHNTVSFLLSQRIKTNVFRAGFLGFVQTSSQISQATETKLFLTTAHRAHVVLPFRNNDEIYDIHEPNNPFGSLELREYLMSLAWCWELSMTS